MNSGEKIYLKVIMQRQRVTLGGITISEIRKVGAVVRARPGPVIDGTEYIALLLDREYRWNDQLREYDPETINDDPANESRWVAI